MRPDFLAGLCSPFSHIPVAFPSIWLLQSNQGHYCISSRSVPTHSGAFKPICACQPDIGPLFQSLKCSVFAAGRLQPFTTQMPVPCKYYLAITVWFTRTYIPSWRTDLHGYRGFATVPRLWNSNYGLQSSLILPIGELAAVLRTSLRTLSCEIIRLNQLKHRGCAF